MVDDFTLEEVLAELETRQREGGWATRYFNNETTRQDYPKHWEFFDAGLNYVVRLFTAGNQVGKSVSAAVELVQHVTGVYHEDWKGYRFGAPINVWIVGKTAELIRQTIQPMLLGQVGEFGTGLIAKEYLDLETLTDAKRAATPINTFRVKHARGGYSTISMKSGEQGREAFQAATLDLIWCDEEIPFDVFNECLVRLMVRQGIMLYTFTPLKGITPVIKSFSVNGSFVEGDVGAGRYVVRCSMYDAAHQSKKAIEQLIASTPPYLRDARVFGIPALGAGAIWPVPESEFVIKSFTIPEDWPRLYGMDVGGKTAAVWLAQDPSTNQWHTYAEYYRERQEPSIHASAVKARGDWIPGAIDPASRGRSQIDGQQLMQMYEDLGLDIVKANNAVDTGIQTVWELLSSDQLKVHDNCTFLLQEIRGYQRDEKGNIKKEDDHLCDAWRYAVMTRDIAVQKRGLNKSFTGQANVRPVF